MSILTVGDFALLNKPTPHYDLGTSVQIAAVYITKGKVQYTAAVMLKDRLFDIIGPLPAETFVFVRPGNDTHVATLIKHVGAEEKRLRAIRAERQRLKHAPHCMCDDCILM